MAGAQDAPLQVARVKAAMPQVAMETAVQAVPPVARGEEARGELPEVAK